MWLMNSYKSKIIMSFSIQASCLMYHDMFATTELLLNAETGQISFKQGEKKNQMPEK